METGSERVRFDHKVLPREQAGGGVGNTELMYPDGRWLHDPTCQSTLKEIQTKKSKCC